MGTRGTCACVMMSDSTDERCCDSQRHALRQLTPRSFHCCSVHSTQTRPARFARSPHPKAKGLLTPSPLAAPEGRIAVPEWDDAAAGALRGDPRASITKGEAEANDDLCSLCAANHDIPRSLPSSHPPQAARLARPPGHAGPDARAVGAVRTQTAFVGGRSVAPGRPARPRCAPEGRLPLMWTAPDRPAPGACAGTTHSAVCPETHDATPLLAPARRPWPVARPLPRPSALSRPSSPRPHTPR